MGFLSSSATAFQKRSVDSVQKSRKAHHDKNKFFPVQVGQCFHNRYVVKRHLGRGRYGDVWLVQDKKTNELRALKILNSDFYNGRYQLFELEVMQRVSRVSAHSTHPGRHRVSKLLDHFDLFGPTGRHVCIVMPLLGASIADQTTSGRIIRLPPQVVKRIAKQMLEALDFLHTECGVIHTDIQPSNILQDLKGGNWQESTQPMPDNDAIKFRLNDLGVACFTDRHLTDRIQSPYLRSPEITLEAPWDRSVDTYSLGCLLYQFITGDLPFPGKSSRGSSRTVEQDRMATLLAHFGPVPDIVLDNAARTKDFEHAVDLRGSKDQTNTISVEEVVERRTVDRNAASTISREEISLFCDFLRRLLATDPRMRESTGTLLQHPWLSTP